MSVMSDGIPLGPGCPTSPCQKVTVFESEEGYISWVTAQSHHTHYFVLHVTEHLLCTETKIIIILTHRIKIIIV